MLDEDKIEVIINDNNKSANAFREQQYIVFTPTDIRSSKKKKKRLLLDYKSSDCCQSAVCRMITVKLKSKTPAIKLLRFILTA